MDSELRLRSGALLSYATYGHPDGTPLFALHGGADSRLIWQLLDSNATQAGVCLIAPDRPGFGNSAYVPGRSTLDHAADIIELADHLGHERFGVITISAGLVFGLAAASAHPDRIYRLTSYAGMFLSAPGAIAEMNPLQKLVVKVCLGFPKAIGPLGWLFFGPQVFLAPRSPQLVYKMLRATRPKGDKQVLARPEIAELMIAGAPSQFRSVPAVTEAMTTQQLPPFPFDLSEIGQDVQVWQGGSDDVHTPAMGKHLAAMCPNATLHLFPELATFDLEVHYDAMLAAAVD